MNEIAETPTPEVVSVTAIESIERAQIDMQITTARKYPRLLSKVKKDMISFATLDQETAESCFYTLPRGAKKIMGPSVRLAEIALSCFQNLRAGTRIVDTVVNPDRLGGHVTIQAVCHDLENNVAVSIEKRRRIVGKIIYEGGQRAGTKPVDEDDINLAANAGSAIAFRDAVFKIVPGALIKPVYEQAKMVAIGDASTLADRRNTAVEKFAKMGVSKDRVLLAVEKKSLEDVNLADLETLFGLFTAIKDGATTIDDAFPVAAPEVAPSTALKSKKGVKAPTAPDPEKKAPETGTTTPPPAGAHKESPEDAKRREIVEALAAIQKEKPDLFTAVCQDHDINPKKWDRAADDKLAAMLEVLK